MPIVCERITFAYPGQEPILRGLSFQVQDGETLCVLGNNGSGKSTLIRLLTGVLRQRSGTIRMQTRVPELRTASFPKYVSVAFHNPDIQLSTATVLDEMQAVQRSLDISKAERDQSIEATLKDFGLSTLRNGNPMDLPYHLRKLVTIASAVARATAVLILDEPTGGLDAQSTETIENLLRREQVRGRAIVLATHNSNLAVRIANALLFLHKDLPPRFLPCHVALRELDVFEAYGVASPAIPTLAGLLGLSSQPKSAKELWDVYEAERPSYGRV